MTLYELLADLPRSPGGELEAKLYFRLFCRYLADHLYRLELQSGAGLRDLTDVKAFLDECVEAISPENGSSTEVPSKPVSRTGPRVIRRQEQPRNWSDCPDCGHVHAGDNECGYPTGGGRVCRCERQVTA